MKILEDLWLDKIPFYQRRPLETEETLRLKKQILEYREKLISMISPEAAELFEKLMDNEGELSSLIECDTFTYGFRLGAKIMLEATDETSHDP